MLAHLYTEDNRYREAFHVMRTALLAHPNSDMTRKIQDEAAATFDSLFLSGKGDALPPIEALGLFYDFRELTPIGRRGDEMIRRLADRLVSVDLLDQAAQLLQHQVDHRLHGAARAQVATKLAIVYLMDRKPDRALAALRRRESSDLSNESRDQRLLLEARAMSDIGRHELALEVIANIKGHEALRLARRHTVGGQALARFRRADRTNVRRTLARLYAIERGRARRRSARGDRLCLADEKIGLLRLREKYAAKMAERPGPARLRRGEFADRHRRRRIPEHRQSRLRPSDTLDAFLRDCASAIRMSTAAAAPKNALPPAKPGAAVKDPKVPASDRAQIGRERHRKSSR